jgi:ferritin-like protein
MEELEAVDWYDQRVQAASSDELKAILAHNRDEEKEHACMMLEWLRRNDPVFDENLRTYLFAEGSIIGAEVAEKAEKSGGASGPAEGDGDSKSHAAAAPRDESLGIGSLKGK